MASVVLIHGAFNELWGPHELKARWLPAVRDGLWLNGATIDESDVDVCFYGDLFRIEPETLDADEWAESRAGAEELLEAVAGGDTLGFLGQAASLAEGAAVYRWLRRRGYSVSEVPGGSSLLRSRSVPFTVSTTVR